MNVEWIVDQLSTAGGIIDDVAHEILLHAAHDSRWIVDAELLRRIAGNLGEYRSLMETFTTTEDQ